MRKIMRAYLNGMALMGPVTVEAIMDELREFIEEPSFEEFFDVLHGVLRLTRINALGLIAWPTAKKHAMRMIERGCPRSERNCNKAKECICSTTQV